MFWKEVGKVNGGKVEYWNRIGSAIDFEKEYFEDLHNVYTEEGIIVNMRWFDDARKK